MSGLSTPAAASSAHNLDTRLHLFTPLQVGAFELKHRIVMAPLTRMRANRPGNEPSALNALYYTQRASEGGLIIAEASQVVPEGQGPTSGLAAGDRWRACARWPYFFAAVACGAYFALIAPT